MRPGTLYFKILFSFLAVLFLTLVVTFVLFLALPGRHLSARLEDFAETKAKVIRDAVEEKIRQDPRSDWSQNKELRAFVWELGNLLGAKVWLEHPHHGATVRSFSGDIPPIVSRANRYYARVFRETTLYHQRGLDLYAVVPFTPSPGEKGTIHILYQSRPHSLPPPLDHPEGLFALGLLLIGLMAALFFIPVSLIITRRLKNLRRSALIISEGNLSHRVSVRGRDEIGELGRAFNQMAEKLEGMIENSRDLTAHVSHELRSPLTRIRIAEEMIRQKTASGDCADLEKHWRDIEEDIQVLDHLIGRILYLSKWDRQASPLHMEPLDAVALIRNILDRFQGPIQHRGLRLVTHLPQAAILSGDKEALSTALTNLLDNAVKFTPEGGRISLSLRPVSDRLEISIINSAERLPEEDLKRIFDPFYRPKETRAAGSGLGLAITRKIIEGHGGNIRAENSPEGLEFKITLQGGRAGAGENGAGQTVAAT